MNLEILKYLQLPLIWLLKKPDQSLAATQDLAAQSGTGGGGATALAAACC